MLVVHFKFRTWSIGVWSVYWQKGILGTTLPLDCKAQIAMMLDL